MLRIRPTKGIDDYEDDFIKIQPEEGQVLLQPPISRATEAEAFKFDEIFGPEVQQKEVFDATVDELVEAALQGKNACLFTYG